jgi:hypothetical protein
MRASQLEFVAEKIGQMLPRRNAAAKRRAVDDCRYLHFEGQTVLTLKIKLRNDAIKAH